MSSLTETQYLQQQLLLLRTIVAALGERVTPPWWRTQFLTEVGLRAMVRVFPRTAASAALNSVLLAARADHDKRIGVGGRYHLFRLPSNIEHAIALLMSEASFRAKAVGLVTKPPEELIHELGPMTHGRKTTAAEGAVRVGPSRSILQPAGVEALAVYYSDSFKTGRRAFPYFVDVEEAA